MLTGLGVIGYGSMEKADLAATGAAKLQVSVDALNNSLMPRQEVQAKLDASETNIKRIEAEQDIFRATLMRLELEVAHVTGRSLSPKDKERGE